MKLGNYKWMVCNKCGKHYAQVPGGKPHKCGILHRIGFIQRIIEKRREKAEEHMNDLFNAGEDKRGNPIF